MSKFPDGQLFVREFSTLLAAHVFASRIAEIAAGEASKECELRLIELAPTAEGAWVCGWVTGNFTKYLSGHADESLGETVLSDAKLVNALLSLGPKPSANAQAIEILEGASIMDVLRSAQLFSQAGHTLLEVRIKKSGAVKGAYAFVEKQERVDLPNIPTSVSHARVSLIGDYRRYFL